MENLVAVIWLICWPLAIDLGDSARMIARAKAGLPVKEYSGVEAFAALASLVIWCVVGVALWR